MNSDCVDQINQILTEKKKKLWKYAADKDKVESQKDSMSQKIEGEVVSDP